MDDRNEWRLISPEVYNRLMIRMGGVQGHTRACQKAGGVSFDGSRCICGMHRVQQELIHSPKVHPRNVDYLN